MACNLIPWAFMSEWIAGPCCHCYLGYFPCRGIGPLNLLRSMGTRRAEGIDKYLGTLPRRYLVVNFG